MKTFNEFILERSIDSQELAKRVASRFGVKSSFGKWEKVIKGKHIPLTSFDARKSNVAADKLYAAQKKLGMFSKETSVQGKAKYDQAHETKSLKISELFATQPFVRIEDDDKLKAKILEKDPKHIHVVVYKGINYIADGHHSVMAAMLRGDETVSCNVINLDNLKFT